MGIRHSYPFYSRSVVHISALGVALDAVPDAVLTLSRNGESHTDALLDAELLAVAGAVVVAVVAMEMKP